MSPWLLLLLLLVSAGASVDAQAPPANSSQGAAAAAAAAPPGGGPRAIPSRGRVVEAAEAQLLLKPPPWLRQRAADAAFDDRGAPPRAAAAAAPAAAAAAAQAKHLVTQRFIVQLAEEPAAAAVSPPAAVPLGASVAAPLRRNVSLDVTRSRVLRARAASVAAAANLAGKVTHTYSYALAGFAVANPTQQQLAALAADPNVVSVTRDRAFQLLTYSTPRFLGLSGSAGGSSGSAARPGGSPSSSVGGVWAQLGGVLGNNGAGESVIIAMLDTGIWMPDHACFADSNYVQITTNSQNGQSYRQVLDWKGMCAADETKTAACNNKVIGGRYYTSGWGGDEAVKAMFPNEYISWKDGDGHGSHTASTAGGNFGYVAPSTPAGYSLSGMAPRARLASYKVCWGMGNDGAACLESDVIAALDDVIQDGADVINYSVGGPTTSFRGPADIAFMHAARAGIFVSAAAGNAGPDAGTIENISPWVTSVAASSHDRFFTAPLILGNGQTYIGGGSQTTALGPRPLVYAGDLALNSSVATEAALCAPGSLRNPPAGAIVACDRGGGYNFADKFGAVGAAGAGGLVMLNVPGGKTNTYWDAFGLPHVHLVVGYRDAVIAYARSAGATATLGAQSMKLGGTAPAMASFSSRGPVAPGGGVLLKPDITAPGESVVAAYTGDAGSGGPLYASLSGTSMATPHITGIAALVKGKFPTWGPMAIKSALITSAYQTTRTGDVGLPFGTALDYGGGHVDPAAALNPGLVFESSYEDWQRFLCDVEPDPSDPACAKLCKNYITSQQAQPQALSGALAAPASAQAAAGGVVVEEAGAASGLDAVGGAGDGLPWHRDNQLKACAAEGLNMPSVAGLVVGSLTVTRTATAVTLTAPAPASSSAAAVGPVKGGYGTASLTYTATAAADAGSALDISVSPASFKVAAVGRQQRVSITIKKRADTALDTYQFGQVLWTSSRGHRVRIPVAVTFAAWHAPPVIAPPNRKASSTFSFTVAGDFASSVAVSSRGFGPAQVTAVSVKQAVSLLLTDPETGLVPLTIPAGNTYVMIAIFSEDVPAGTNLDVYVLQGNETIGYSNGFRGSTEILEAPDGLQAGDYQIYVYGASVSSASVTAHVHVWLMPGPGGANAGAPRGGATLQVSPSLLSFAAGGTKASVSLAFSGLAFGGTPPTRYLGVVQYTRADGQALSNGITRVQMF